VKEGAVLNRRMIVGLAVGSLLLSGHWTRVAAGQSQEGSVPAAQSPDPAAAGSVAAAPLTMSLAQAAATQPPPEPTHTGFAALVISTGGDFAAFPRRKSTWVILGVGAGAAALAHPFDDNVNDSLQDSTGLRRAMKPGKYLGYAWVQGGAAVGLYLVGRYAMKPEQGTHTNKVSHLGFDLLRANLVTSALTYGIKYAVRRDRPTGECCAFPSGHASVTFATASVLERHFGYRGSWPMFAIAGYVSASRLTENRHFLSDVLFGSALGMASGWTVVGRHGRDKFAMMPVPIHGGLALAGSWSPQGRSN
jgi:membrane-associated phospholipid phosphatase